MAAATYNLIIDQGADFNISLALTQDGSAIDLSGYSVRAQMRTKTSSTSIAATFTGVVTDAANGLMTLSLTNVVTTALAAGCYVYDLEIYTASDVIVDKLLKGTATVRAEVTR